MPLGLTHETHGRCRASPVSMPMGGGRAPWPRVFSRTCVQWEVRLSTDVSLGGENGAAVPLGGTMQRNSVKAATEKSVLWALTPRAHQIPRSSSPSDNPGLKTDGARGDAPQRTAEGPLRSRASGGIAWAVQAIRSGKTRGREWRSRFGGGGY